MDPVLKALIFRFSAYYALSKEQQREFQLALEHAVDGVGTVRDYEVLSRYCETEGEQLLLAA